MATPSAFIGCDWGSTSFRLRIVELESRRVLAEQSAPNGIKTFAVLPAPERADAMARFLAARLAAWPDTPADQPVIVSGMASSTVGWQEVPYARTPFPLDGASWQVGRVGFAAANGQRREAWLVGGVRTDDDMMRGEECALIGAHALCPTATHGPRPTLALLAGTHPKHATLHQGALLTFHTHLTGELFDVLSGTSLLSASVERAAAGTPPDLEQFCAGVARVRDDGLSASLFQVRAREVLHRNAKAGNAWFLSGLLVGAELERVAGHPELLLIGDELRVTLYREALRVLRPNASAPALRTVELNAAVVAGQAAIFRRHGPGRAG